MKEQARYAKLNALVLRYLWVSLLVAGALGGVFGGSLYLLREQSSFVTSDVASKKAELAAINRTFTPKAADASSRLNAVKFVQSSQTRFSAVIADIAKVLPQGVSIESITLTGEDAKPVRIVASAGTYDQALAFRNAMASSPRVAAADLESITSGEAAGGFQAALVIGFKPGQAK